jgi:hypothetical protein
MGDEYGKMKLWKFRHSSEYCGAIAGGLASLGTGGSDNSFETGSGSFVLGGIFGKLNLT